MTIDEITRQQLLRCLTLLNECPPTIRQIFEAGDRAIDASGLNPWCMNEGLAEGSERHTPWFLSLLIEQLSNPELSDTPGA